MKAVIINEFGGPEKLIYTDVEKPVPGPKDILVRNEAIGVGKPEYLVRTGAYPYLGNECGGIVEEVGSEVTGFVPGDKVWVLHTPGYGAYAEYICVDARWAKKVPQGMPAEYIPGLLNWVLAYCLLNEAGRGTDGKSAYILGGAGGVGTALIQMALYHGLQVISAADTPEKCEYIKRLGVQCVFDCTKEDAKDVILDYTDGRGVDLIFDQLVGPHFKEQFEYLADFGQIVVYNWLEGSPELDQLGTLVGQAAHASAVRPFSLHVYDDKPQRLARFQEYCVRLLAEDVLKPIIYDVLPLSEARRAHELLDAQAIMGKLILKP